MKNNQDKIKNLPSNAEALKSFLAGNFIITGLYALILYITSSNVSNWGTIFLVFCSAIILLFIYFLA